MSGRKCLDEFQLKAAEFHDSDGARGHFFDAGDQRGTDVARQERFHTGDLQDVVNQRRGGGLSVGARNADQFAFEKSIGQFNFTPDRDALGARSEEEWIVGRHAGAGDNQVLGQESFLGVTAKFQYDAGFTQFCGDVAKFGFRSGFPSPSRWHCARRRRVP